MTISQRMHILCLLLLLRWTAAAPSADLEWSGKTTQWQGYARHSFQCDGRDAWVVAPEKAASGNPWVWRARFPGYHHEADLLLLDEGLHIAYINTDGMLGSPSAMRHWDVFYTTLTEAGLSKKVALEGVSRGGLFIYAFAARWPDRVACIYADTPVCDFKSWPLGSGVGIGHQPTWKRLLTEYGFSREQALQYRGNPIDHLKPIASAKIPVLHIVSLNDLVVPPDENTFVLARRFRDLGGSIDVIRVTEGTAKSNGHHFDHPDPEQVASFIQDNSMTERSSK